jgi:hypothetical protein
MHEHDTNNVITNLLALSRMVTAWTPEPIDISHMVRFACVAIAQQAIWESMQTDYWNDALLVAMQREWESVDFFTRLPETAELSCASIIKTCQAARNQSYVEDMGGWGELFRSFRYVFTSPVSGFRNVGGMFQEYGRQASYRNKGSYEDEKALLLYFSERKKELDRAVTLSTWEQMRSSSNSTNPVIFQGAKQSRITAIMNIKQLHVAAQGQGRGNTLLSRAAHAEATRRLIVTAIALERFSLKDKKYPQSLSELVPAFLPAVPVDFIDGKKLRYCLNESGRYVLYSVGLDGVDNSGQMITPKKLTRGYASMSPSAQVDTDIVWPRPATQADVDLFEKMTAEQEREYQERVKAYQEKTGEFPTEFE